MGYSPWGSKELDTTKWLTHTNTHTRHIYWTLKNKTKKNGIKPIESESQKVVERGLNVGKTERLAKGYHLSDTR